MFFFDLDCFIIWAMQLTNTKIYIHLPLLSQIVFTVLWNFLFPEVLLSPAPPPTPPPKKNACQLSFTMRIKTLTISRCLLFGIETLPIFPIRSWQNPVPLSSGIFPTYENQALGTGVSISSTSTGRVKLHKNSPSARDVQLSTTRAITPLLSFDIHGSPLGPAILMSRNAETWNIILLICIMITSHEFRHDLELRNLLIKGIYSCSNNWVCIKWVDGKYRRVSSRSHSLTWSAINYWKDAG